MKFPKLSLLAERFFPLALFVALACFTLSANSLAQAENRSPARIEGLDLQHQDFLKFKPEVLAIFQGYYAAVEAGDFDEALTYYGWAAVNKMKREEREAAQENALAAARLVKQQIEQNGGVRSVAVHGVFRIKELAAVVEVEFNNGTRDLSPVVPMVYETAREKEKREGEGEWKLEVVTVNMKIPPPLVGLSEILATLETIYRAALEEDLEQMRALSYEEGLFLGLKEQNPKEREKRIARIYDVATKRIQQATGANGGLVSMDIPLMQESSVYVYTKPGEEPIAIASAVIRRNFGNGKSQAWQTSFFLDRDGRWKANPNTLR